MTHPMYRANPRGMTTRVPYPQPPDAVEEMALPVKYAKADIVMKCSVKIVEFI